MESLSFKWKQADWWNWHQKHKAIIRCPQCNARHYPTRLDNKKLAEDGRYGVACGCGLHYWVMDGGSDLIIRRYRDGETNGVFGCGKGRSGSGSGRA